MLEDDVFGRALLALDEDVLLDFDESASAMFTTGSASEDDLTPDIYNSQNF